MRERQRGKPKSKWPSHTGLTAGLGLLLALTFGAFTSGAALPLLRDLDAHWSRSAVSALLVRGAVRGHLDGTFRPDETVTRAETARLLATALGLADTGNHPLVSRYADVSGHWAAAAVEALAETGTIRGYPDRTFGPDRPVSRIELLVMAVRAIGLPTQRAVQGSFPVPYTDLAQVPSWAVLEAAAAAAEGLTSGLFGQQLQPLLPATRAEAAALAARVAGRRGALFEVSGTVEHWDRGTRRLTLLTAQGDRQTLQIPPDAATFRQGVPSLDLRPLDQAWVVAAPGGTIFQVEARYGDLLGQMAQVRGDTIQLLPEGSLVPIRVSVSPKAAIFVNGRPSTLPAVTGAGYVYLVLDAETGSARMVDAVQYTDAGVVTAIRADGLRLRRSDGVTLELRLDPNIIIYKDGQPVAPGALQSGQRVVLFRQGSQVTFVQVHATAPEPAAGPTANDAGAAS